MNSKILLLILLCCLTPAIHGQEIDSISKNIIDIELYFRFNRSSLDKDYMQNAKKLEYLNHILIDSCIISNLDSISINATSSPEGDSDYNKRLSIKRVNTIKNFIQQQYPYINFNKVIANSSNENWSGLLFLVENDINIPFRNEILAILNQPISSRERELKLKLIGNGKAWNYINKNILSKLRSSTINIVTHHTNTSLEVTEEEILMVPVIDNNSKPIVEIIVKEEPICETVNLIEYERKPLFAAKTNLLFDVATALNVELEVPIGKRWSVAGEWIFPWWLLEKKQYCLQVLSGNIEGKYWFGKREERLKLTGWFAGLYAGGGLYDIEWGKKGYQGEFFIAAGISGGFAHTINKKGNLRMEYTLGIGYLKTNYREYTPKYGFVDDEWHLIRKHNGRYAWFGPTRAKVSLVWMLDRKVKKGGIK